MEERRSRTRRPSREESTTTEEGRLARLVRLVRLAGELVVGLVAAPELGASLFSLRWEALPRLNSGLAKTSESDESYFRPVKLPSKVSPSIMTVCK